MTKNKKKNRSRRRSMDRRRVKRSSLATAGTETGSWSRNKSRSGVGKEILQDRHQYFCVITCSAASKV